MQILGDAPVNVVNFRGRDVPVVVRQYGQDNIVAIDLDGNGQVDVVVHDDFDRSNISKRLIYVAGSLQNNMLGKSENEMLSGIREILNRGWILPYNNPSSYIFQFNGAGDGGLVGGLSIRNVLEGGKIFALAQADFENAMPTIRRVKMVIGKKQYDKLWCQKSVSTKQMTEDPPYCGTIKAEVAPGSGRAPVCFSQGTKEYTKLKDCFEDQ